MKFSIIFISLKAIDLEYDLALESEHDELRILEVSIATSHANWASKQLLRP
jgi:hypothetical protein